MKMFLTMHFRNLITAYLKELDFSSFKHCLMKSFSLVRSLICLFPS